MAAIFSDAPGTGLPFVSHDELIEVVQHALHAQKLLCTLQQ
jgi:hypothetical protein